MQIALVSLFPEMFAAISDHGVTGRAVRQGLLELSHRNPRDFTTDRHRTVDDRPYGGGPGMVMMIDPLQQAIAAARAALGGDAKVIFLSPQGRRFDHRVALELAREPALVLIAGRYEGVDERLLEAEVDEELSIGDYVLSGGELAAMVVIDAITRQFARRELGEERPVRLGGLRVDELREERDVERGERVGDRLGVRVPRDEPEAIEGGAPREELPGDAERDRKVDEIRIEIGLPAGEPVEIVPGSAADVRDRLAVDAFVEGRPYHDDRTLVISHGGVIRVILCQVLGYPLERLLELDVGHASLRGIRVRSGWEGAGAGVGVGDARGILAGAVAPIGPGPRMQVELIPDPAGS